MRLAWLAIAACGRVGFDAPCPSGATIPVVRVVPDSQTGHPEDACNVDNALALDGVVAGLDRSGSSTCNDVWDPVQGSCGCLAVDLGAVYPIGSASVWAAPTGDACGTHPCLDTSCGTGHSFGILVGTELDQYIAVANVGLTAGAITEYPVTIGTRARYLVVCREAWGQERDDVVVDAIVASCE